MINYNYDKSWKVVPVTQTMNSKVDLNKVNKMQAISPSTCTFPINDKSEAPSPHPVSHSSKQTEEDKKGGKNKRKRKTKAQVKKLEDKFRDNPHWTNDDVERISRDIKLDKSQVYKWNWDQKKKQNILPSKVYVVASMPDSIQQLGQTQILNDNKTKVVYINSPSQLQNLKNKK